MRKVVFRCFVPVTLFVSFSIFFFVSSTRNAYYRNLLRFVCEHVAIRLVLRNLRKLRFFTQRFASPRQNSAQLFWQIRIKLEDDNRIAASKSSFDSVPPLLPLVPRLLSSLTTLSEAVDTPSYLSRVAELTLYLLTGSSDSLFDLFALLDTNSSNSLNLLPTNHTYDSPTVIPAIPFISTLILPLCLSL